MGAAGVTGKPLPTATVGGGGGGVCPRAGGPGRHRRPSGAASIRGLACAAAPSAAASGAAGVGSSAFWPRCTRPRGPPAVAPLSLAQRCPEFLEGRASNFPLPGLGTCCWWAAAAAAAERSICVSGCRVPTAPTRPLTHAAAAQPSVGGGGGWGPGPVREDHRVVGRVLEAPGLLQGGPAFLGELSEGTPAARGKSQRLVTHPI